MKKYGMPYKGSKTELADRIIDILPAGDVLVDAFGGGGAITDCAARSGKWEQVIYNEFEPLIYNGFCKAINGEYANETRWISREDFFRLKDTDPYAAICFSFCCNLKNYAYAPEIERFKRHLHYMAFSRTPAEAMTHWREFVKEFDRVKQDIADITQSALKLCEECGVMPIYNADGTLYAEKIKKDVFKQKSAEIRKYMRSALERSGRAQAEVDKYLGNQMSGHYFGQSQWALPTAEQYAKLQTIITEVLEDIRTAHPLLDLIDFKNTTAITKWVVNKQGQQSAVWGQLTTAITEELSGNIDTVDMTLCKLTAFMYISNDILDLGPAWVDTYIRNILSEALAIGLETGIVDGDGKDKPIGMTRDVSDDAAIVGGVYPRKDEVTVTAFDPETYGTLLSTLAISPTGKQRTLGTPIMVVNPADYFKIVFPATTILTPNGIYATDVLPYPTRIVQSVAVPANHAVLGIGRLYFMGLGMSKNGRIETSEEYKFLEDLTTYKIKTYGNGFPKDNNAFLYLNIQNLAPTYPTVNNIPLEP
ncbi:MAG: phage major capsid protein [Ruminiclostridium sp.]|nr:phage major capsid protein [Ruminiclostridium sp.]